MKSVEIGQGVGMRQQRWSGHALALGAVLMLGAAPLGWAEDLPIHCPVCARANSETASYPSKAGSTLVRGATNTLFGWTEILRQPARQAKGGGNLFTGVLAGLGQGAQRTLVGAGELLTFWTPKVQDRYLRLSHDCPLCMGKR
jgi:putative exosortase-associated protein (TIGR04073 family)